SGASGLRRDPLAFRPAAELARRDKLLLQRPVGARAAARLSTRLLHPCGTDASRDTLADPGARQVDRPLAARPVGAAVALVRLPRPCSIAPRRLRGVPMIYSTSRYCRRCWAPLGMTRPPLCERPRCAQCSLPYAPDNPETFSSVPHWLYWRQWLPGLVLGIVSGLIAYVVIWTYGRMDAALFIAVPLSMGTMLGYTIRARIWLTIFLTLFAVTTLTCGVTAMGLHGLFCGATLWMICVGPAFLGALLGLGLRVIFRNSAWDRRKYGFMLGIAVLPYAAWGTEELWPAEEEIAEVRTEMGFPAGPEPTWQSIVFYEQVEHEPPWLLRLALPRPVGTEGRKSAPGDIERCIYHKGHLVKQITDAVEPERLAFRVIEQHLHFE